MLPNSGAADMNTYFSAMSTGEPYRTYKKTILGQVYITVLSMLTGTPSPEGIMLHGDPRKNDPDSMYDVWSEQEDRFFKKMNRWHLEHGTLIEHKRAKVVKERTIEEFSDDELRTLINKPFLALKNTLNSTTSVATLFRIQTLAEELEKSEKVINAIKSRISEVQEASMPNIPSEIEEER